MSTETVINNHGLEVADNNVKPRYDDVYFEGLNMLEESARCGDWMPCCGYFVFDDEVCECEKSQEEEGADI